MSIDPPLFALRQIADCPHCGLHQYLTENGACRRCNRPIGVEFIHLPLNDLARQLSDKELRLLPNRVGLAIRDLRSRRGISQEKLARAARTGRSHLSRIECGHVRPPLSTLLRVTGALGLDAVILRFENSKLPSNSPTSHRS
jgi:ribosome-binding protein aMBF1 (putative translation factor)